MDLLMRKSKTILFVAFICISHWLHAQDRYVVFFTDKVNSTYSLEKPEEFLSARSLARRAKNKVSLSEMDLPVNQAYIDAVRALGIETYFSSKWMNALIVQMQEADQQALMNLPFVQEVVYVAQGTLLSSQPDENPIRDGIITETASIDRSRDQNQMLAIDQMHADGVFGEGVLIGVFDSGFKNFRQIPAFQHLLDQGQIQMTLNLNTGAEQVENTSSHGTGVLSILAAQSALFTSPVPEADYALFITEFDRDEYRIEEYNWLIAAEKADSLGVDIINSSLGYSRFSDPQMDYSQDQLDGQSAVVSQAASWATQRGILVVSSAGNEGNKSWGKITFPADQAEVLTVGAVDRNLNKSSFSGLGPNAIGQLKPDVVALGSSTALIDAQGAVKLQNGTSFSAPLVAGLAAGLLAAFPELNRQSLFDLIKNSASLSTSPNNQLGHGLPHYTRAKNIIQIAEQVQDNELLVYPNPVVSGRTKVLVGDALYQNWQGMELVNARGDKLAINQMDASTNPFEINLSNLPKGIYFLRVYAHDMQEVKKILIQ
jgi:subtilisin family serine protease